MKNLSLSLLAVLALASVTPAFADEIGPGYCSNPELCRSTMTSMSEPTTTEPEDEVTQSEDETNLMDYLTGAMTF